MDKEILERAIKGNDMCREKYNCSECPYHGLHYCHSILCRESRDLLKEQEEQKRKWLQNIADNQLANSPKHDRDDFMSLDEHLEYQYQLGVYDGLQMAYDILTEGR